MTASTIYQNGEYFAKHPTWHAEDAPWKAAQICRMLERNALSPETACEVGCGSGAILAELQQRSGNGTKFWGYEVSPQAYELCRRLSNPNLQFVLGDVLVEPPAQLFDVVLVMDVVEHVEDHMTFLREIRGLGRFKIFHFPLDLSAQGILRGIPCKVRSTAGHLHYFTKDLVLRTLEDAGYRVLDYFYTPAASATRRVGVSSRLMRIPRKALFAIDPDAAALWLGGFSLLVLTV